MIFYIKARVTWVLFFFFFSSISFGSSLSLSAVADAHTSLLSRFRVYNTTTYSFHTLSNPRWKKNCSVDFSSNVPAVARALCNQGSGRGRTSISRDMCVCVRVARARARACDVARATVWYHRSDQHIIFLRKRNSFFPFFLLNITRLRLNSNLCSKQR